MMFGGIACPPSVPHAAANDSIPRVGSVTQILHALHGSSQELVIDFRPSSPHDWVSTPELADSCVQVALALAANSSLTFLRVVHCPQDLARALARAVAYSKTLSSLVYVGNVDETGVALAQALEASGTLKSFEFAPSPRMSNASGAAIAKALARSASLEVFQITIFGNLDGPRDVLRSFAANAPRERGLPGDSYSTRRRIFIATGAGAHHPAQPGDPGAGARDRHRGTAHR